MKIALIGDTHAGARNDSDFYIKHQSHFFEKIFFPTLKAKGIKNIFHLGDVLNNRRSINIKSLASLNTSFIYRCLDEGFNVHFILGNHDIYYKNNRDLSALKELYGRYESDSFHIISEPTTVNIDGVDIFLAPWITPDEDFKKGYATVAKICLGHFEFAGFQQMKNVIAKSGLDRSMVEQFDVVFSGHYHTPSNEDNIMYVGSPYQMTFADQADRKRFILFDPETYGMEFVYNDNHLFHQIEYADDFDVDGFDYKSVADTNIKIIVNEKDNVAQYETFIQRLTDVEPFTITTVDKYVIEDVGEDIADIEKDTVVILMESVDTMEIPDARIGPVKDILKKLYDKATS